ncbi:hypothetical protein QYF36_009452 [Acer negundo]|nr:hypothetical protein QYF36_009452 [Acer negundo]
MESEKGYEVDLGNIMAFNPSHHFPSLPPSNSRLPIVKLPPPTTKLPREKHLPKPKPPTKWELFAQKKGIKKCKKDKV